MINIYIGIANPYDVRNILNNYVENQMFGNPDDTKQNYLNNQFYPSIKCISNHIYKASYQLKLSKLDQINLKEQIEKWSKENNQR